MCFFAYWPLDGFWTAHVRTMFFTCLSWEGEPLRNGPKLVKVMACYLVVPSHNLTCWFAITLNFFTSILTLLGNYNIIVIVNNLLHDHVIVGPDSNVGWPNVGTLGQPSLLSGSFIVILLEVQHVSLALTPAHFIINSFAPGRDNKDIGKILFASSSCDFLKKQAWVKADVLSSTLAQVMAWCSQTTSFNLWGCWPRSLSLYCVTREYWDNMKIVLWNKTI